MMSPLVVSPYPGQVGIEDALDGPYSVYEDQKCTYCSSDKGVVVKNGQGDCVYEICNCCGFEKDYEEKGFLN